MEEDTTQNHPWQTAPALLVQLNLDLRSFKTVSLLEKLELAGYDLKEENSATQQRICPQSSCDIQMEDGKAKVVLKKASWNVLRFRL